jgi:hypothetical protein
MAKKQAEEETEETDSPEETAELQTNVETEEEDKNIFSGIKYALPIIFVFFLIYAYIFSQFQQIPGPMYGGDYYFHYGIVQHIFNGNMPWTCPQFQGEWAFYPWLFHTGVAVFGWITGDIFKSYVLYFPLLVILLAGIIVYLLGKELFEKTEFALLTTLAFMGTRLYMDYIPASFTVTLMAPLFLLTTLKAYKTAEIKWIAAAGVSFGLFTLSHGSGLLVGGFFLLILLFYMLFEGRITLGFNSEAAQWNFGFEKAGFTDSLKKSLKIILPLGIIGFLIGLLYWGPILFIYHFKILNPWNEFTQPDFAIYGGQIAKDLILGYLFSIDSLATYPHAFVSSVLALAGIVIILKGKKDKNSTFLAVAFFSGFLGYFHYFITTPLLNTNFAPVRFETFMISPIAFLLSIYTIYWLYNKIKTQDSRKTLLAIAAVYFIIASAMTFNILYNDKWTAQIGLQPQDKATKEMSAWIEKYTDKNVVFLTHDEVAFAVNGLTGRKVMFERRTHANPYVDMNQRIADGGVILFGNDSKKTLELLKKYNVTYVFWDLMWMATINERPGYAFSQPMMTEPKYDGYLAGYGVNFTRATTYLDPSWRDTYKKYDVLAIMPAKMNVLQPWSDEFNKHLKPVMEVQVQNGNQNIPRFRIYEVDYSTF